MSVFDRAFNITQKKTGRAFALALLLALFLAVAFALNVFLGLNYLKSEAFINNYNAEYGCVIQDNMLSCNKDYYSISNGSMIIDTNYTSASSYPNARVILTQDSIINRNATETQTTTYAELLSGLNTNGNLSINDILNYIHDATGTIVTVVFIMMFVFSYIWFLIANVILALIIMLFIQLLLKVKITFKEAYILSFVVALPYVLFNSIVRLVLDNSLAGYIGSLLPIGGSFIRVIIDYAIMILLAYYVIKAGQKLLQKDLEDPQPAAPLTNNAEY